MADVHSPEIRSKNMRAIRSANTKPELLVRKALFAAGFRYRLSPKRNLLPCKPDIILPKYTTVIFVHGCFWHGHDCKYFKVPKTRSDYWLEKIRTNRARDANNVHQLNLLGWHVIQVWECDTRSSGIGVDQIIRTITACLTGRCKASPAGITYI